MSRSRTSAPPTAPSVLAFFRLAPLDVVLVILELATAAVRERRDRSPVPTSVPHPTPQEATPNPVNATPKPTTRTMTPAQRAKVSARMKKYWAAQRRASGK